jgi:hypothetical protein
MSALGQKRTSSLVNRIVRAGQKRGRHFETERFGSLKVDYKLILSRRLHWQVRGLFALEDAIEPA